MKKFRRSIVALGLFLGVSVQAGTTFNAIKISPNTVKVLNDLGRKCHVNPETAPDEWVNIAMSYGNNRWLNEATQALDNNDKNSYQVAIKHMGCPINNKGTWSIN